jgi:hypothetical protein
MKQRWMVSLAAVALAAGLFLIGAPANAQPRRGTAIGPRAVTGSDMFRQRTTPGGMLGPGRPYAPARYRGLRRAEFGRARRLRFRHYYGAPYTYYYSAPPPAYYYSPPVAYYYAPPSGYYYYTSAHGRRRHHRNRYRVAGYRGYYTARARRVRHHRRR